jgi:drug/metabolite transporter (DMT)-like permease
LILLLFTATTFTAIRHASVSSVLAIGTAAPIITTLIQVVATGHLALDLANAAGLIVTLVVVPAIIIVGVRQDNRALMHSTPQSIL